RPGIDHLDLPEMAQLLHVAVQVGRPMLWALVDPDKPTERRRITVAGTGHAVEGHPFYVGTFHVRDDAMPELVFHVFDYGSDAERRWLLEQAGLAGEAEDPS